jgi:hypothetical protein
MGEKTNSEGALVGKKEGKSLLRKPIRRWEGSNKTDVSEIKWDDTD